MFIVGTEIFRETVFSTEAELEAVVEKHARLLFGDDTIYLSKKILVRTGEGHGTIPDAFVIDYENEEWHIVEVELVSHGVWRHIVPQLTGQIVACLSQEMRNLVTDRVLEHIASDPLLRDEPGLQQKVVSIILRKAPNIAIPIDGSSDDLETWTQTQKFPVYIWVIKKLQSVTEPNRIAYQLPGDNEASVVSQPTDQSIAVVRRAYAKSLADLIDADLLKDGEELFLNYRGKSFTGRANPSGIILGDSQVYSPSEAALRCYAQAGSQRPTENGWRVWKNKEGQTLNELFAQQQARKDENLKL